MIISKQYAARLVREGKAQVEGMMYDDQDDKSYMIVTRIDQQRTDHYFVGEGDLR